MLNNGGIYQTQAHEFYFQLKQKIHQSTGEDNFMYWGKIKINESCEREFSDFEKVINSNKEIGADTKLFITDYHNFWVAKVESVHSHLSDTQNTLAFYDNKDVSVWFKVVDMDLISAEFEETSRYLSQLYVDNHFENEKINSISPYVGKLRFPLVVEDKNSEDYFRNLYIEDTKRILRENALIEYPQDTENLANQMKSFVLPPHIFSKISHQLKNEILSVENFISRSDISHLETCQQVLFKYLRVLESTMNETIGYILRDEFAETLYVNEEGNKFFDSPVQDTVQLKNYTGNLKIELFVDLFNRNKMFGNISFEFLKEKYPGLLEYFQAELYPFILDNEIVEKRNLSLAGERQFHTTKEHTLLIRNLVLGVGCEGIINKLVHMTFFASGEIRIKSAA